MGQLRFPENLTKPLFKNRTVCRGKKNPAFVVNQRLVQLKVGIAQKYRISHTDTLVNFSRSVNRLKGKR
jgi:hypothetical protein